MGSGSSSPLRREPIKVDPIRLIDFDDFKELGEYPRFPDNRDIARDVSTLDLSDAFVIFVSHTWLRSRPSMAGFKEYPRPDTEDNEQYKLCVAGVESLLLFNKVALKKCYLWIDYGCLEQGDPEVLRREMQDNKRTKHPHEIDRRLGQIMHFCDCMFTPDTALAELVRDRALSDRQRVDSLGHSGYVSRGWCLLEMFHATFIPLSKVSQLKQPYVSRAVDHAFDLKRRPHFVFGATEMSKEKAPHVVPAMPRSPPKRLDPVTGFYTYVEDAKVAKTLMKELAFHFMKPVKVGYDGNTDSKGLRHGHGRYVFPSGGVYEGGYQNGLKHGFGRFEMASGDVYEGGYRNDRREGHGVFKFANGDRFEGTWLNGKPNGQGRVEYATGDVYEGHFKDHMKHGFGIFTFATGCQYEGWYKDDLRHGRGKYTWSDRDVYDGEWKDHMKHGYGEFRFASGALYQGMWREDNRHGKGKYRLMNGEVYEGDYKNDMREGEGTYLFRSGAKYEGTWRKHLKNGLGKLYSPHGNQLVYDGEWVDDKPQGYVDPLLIFEDDIQYMEVMAVIQQAEASTPTVREEPIVREWEALKPTGIKVSSQMTDEYFNEDGVLDEDDDFHPKNLFRRKSEDWIDKPPQLSKADTDLMQSLGVDKNEEKNEYLQEFHVENEIMKINFTPAGAVDIDKHDRIKKMFSPVRKVVKVIKLANVPQKEENIPSASLQEEGADDDADVTQQDEASVEESSPRIESKDDDELLL